ncbi:MAG TPA: hypothetical protein VHG69_12765 [Thermoleophilaceae bacterium]|nr:hypothetical protein [Thermoleophilaceae bacterium]
MAKRTGAKSFERQVDRLYGLPLEEFTRARNELATDLKQRGDGDAAAQVKKLAKPTRSAGAINRAVRANRREARQLLSAADKLSKAQERLLRRGDRDPVGRAVEGERAAVDRLMAEVKKELRRDGGTSEGMLQRARGTLHAVATTPELRDEFEAGRITKDHKAVGFGALGAPAGAAPARRASDAKKKDEARRRVRRAEQEVEAAERALRRAASEREDAGKRLAAAEAAVSRCETELDEAVSELEAAREAAGRA